MSDLQANHQICRIILGSNNFTKNNFFRNYKKIE